MRLFSVITTITLGMLVAGPMSLAQASEGLYEILGVTRDASDLDLRRGFNKGRTEFAKDPYELAKVTLAYETLRDPAKRAAYDENNGHSRKVMQAIHDRSKTVDTQQLRLEADRALDVNLGPIVAKLDRGEYADEAEKRKLVLGLAWNLYEIVYGSRGWMEFHDLRRDAMFAALEAAFDYYKHVSKHDPKTYADFYKRAFERIQDDYRYTRKYEEHVPNMVKAYASLMERVRRTACQNIILY